MDETTKAPTNTTSGAAPAFDSSSSSASASSPSFRHPSSKHVHNKRSVGGFLYRRDGKESGKEGVAKGGQVATHAPLPLPVPVMAAVVAAPAPPPPVMMLSLNKTGKEEG